jgi:DNA-binding PadR family transcriptional regulator
VEQLILQLLTADGEQYGLQLVAASGGRLKRGTVYVTLGRLEAKGYIASRPEAGEPAHGGLRRRLYVVTPLGRRVLRAWASLAALIPEFGR